MRGNTKRSGTASGKYKLSLKKTREKYSVFLMFVWHFEAGNCYEC